MDSGLQYHRICPDLDTRQSLPESPPDWADDSQPSQAALQARLRRLELLAETAGRLLASQQPQRLIESIGRSVMEQLDCQTFINFLLDEKGGSLHLNACAGVPAQLAAAFEWLEPGTAACGGPIPAQSRAPLAAVHSELVKSLDIKAYACQPLIGDAGRIIGTLSFGSSRREAFSQEDLGLIKGVAEQLAAALIRTQGLAALRLQEERYRSLVELSPDAILLSRNETIVLVNAAALDLFGATAPQQILGRSPVDLSAPECHDVIRARMGRLLAGEPVPALEKKIVRLDGSVAEVEERAARLVDGEGPAIQIILRDISERKRAEALLRTRAETLAETNRELEAFSYSISHDLRTPLYALTGFSDLLYAEYAGRLDERGRNLLRRVKSNATTMNEFITSMLSLARISRQQMQLQQVDLSAMAGAIMEELQRLRPERGITVSIEPAMHARADSGLIKLALCNLLGNAWKYTAKTGAARIEFASCQREQRRLFFVRDNGAGFDEQFADSIFAPFQRFHSDKEFAGTGVGLAIVERVIKRHGGTIWAEGAVDQGATFYFTLGS
jgi:PAS domain S-box-containing protein